MGGEYLFIDGGCLRASVRKICAELFGNADAYQPLIPAMATGQYDKVFYYDAVPGRLHGELQAAYEARVQPEHDRFALIQSLDRVHVALGQIVGKDRRQKGVDVRLAVDMMSFAFRGKLSAATLFAGDSDFVPLLRALVAEGLQVTLWHPPQANADLKGAADRTHPFDFRTCYNCFTVDGRRSVFELMDSRSGNVSLPPFFKQFAASNTHTHAGTWRDDVLTIFRGELRTGHWETASVKAAGAELRIAATAFKEIVGWGAPGADIDWIAK